MYKYTSESSTQVYSSYSGYGVEVTDISSATEKADFSRIKRTEIDTTELGGRSLKQGCHFPSLRQGNLTYVQKGRNEMMKHPYIVSSVKYNPNPSTSHSISIEFTPTRSKSYSTTLYAQLPKDPTTVEDVVDFRQFASFVSAKDKSRNALSDNGNFVVIPDKFIIESLPTFTSEYIEEAEGLVKNII